MHGFTWEGLPIRVRFGAGARSEIGAEAERLGVDRALVICTPGRGEALAREIAALMGGRSAGVHAGAVMHTPVEATEAALAVVGDCRADALVAIGGGSTTGLGKALALRTDLPQIVLPTTYAGSEMTPILGQTEAGRKVTQRSPSVLPETVIYDPELTLDLPFAVSLTSGLNAIAHAVEALYAKDRNPVVKLMAEAGIEHLVQALPQLEATPRDLEARSAALHGAWLCGLCLGSVGMALHHRLCHVLGGAFDLPHAATHATVLPHAVAYSTPAAPEAMAGVARLLDAADAAAGLHAFAARLGSPLALGAIGMPENGIERAVDAIMTAEFWTPRPPTRDGMRALLRAAWRGDTPGGA